MHSYTTEVLTINTEKCSQQEFMEPLKIRHVPVSLLSLFG